MHRLADFTLFHRFLILLSCFFIWFSVCCPDWVISIILSYKSLICSSALFIMLFSAFNSVCISANEFSNFSMFLLIYIYIYICIFFVFSKKGLHPQHMEVPR